MVISASGTDKYDMSRPASGYNKAFDGAEILEMYLGEAVSVLEATHLLREDVFSLKLDTGISTSYLSAEYNLVNGTVTVRADCYEYTSVGGSTVQWIPTALFLDGEEYALDGDNGYTAVIENVSEEDDLFADVVYRTRCIIDRDDMNVLLNKLYSDATEYTAELDEAEAEYERLLSEHAQAVKDREDYLDAMAQYELDLAAYEIYLENKSVWDEAYANYQSYANYLRAVEALEYYNNVTLPEYKENKKAFEAYEIVYNEWLKKNAEKEALDERKEEARRQLAILDTAFVRMQSMGLTRSLFDALKSGIIDTVVTNKEQLCAKPYNVDEAVIDMAEQATAALRGKGDAKGLLAEYSELTDEVAKYDFYINNFYDTEDSIGLRTAFTMLVQALDKLYSNRHVRAGIVDQGRNEKFLIFVGQLAIIANGLNGKYTERYEPSNGQSAFNNSYKIDGKDIGTILNGYAINLPNSPLPGENVFLLNIEATEPEPVEDPGNMPEPPPSPVWPGCAYEDPGAPPETVYEPNEPEFVAPAGNPPDEYTPDPYKVSLRKALSDGEIVKREQLDSDAAITFEQSVRKKLTNVTKYTVSFYESIGGALLCEPLTVEEGSAVEYRGAIPTKPEDASATYVFVGWQDAEGNPFDLSGLDRSVDLYPTFEKKLKSYTVTFRVNGISSSFVYTYGQTPEFRERVLRADDEYYRYYHAGWSDAQGSAYLLGESLPEVSGDAVYTATFDREPLHTVTFTVGNQRYSGKYVKGESPIFEGDVNIPDDGFYTYEFLGWRCGSLFVSNGEDFPPVNKPMTYEAQYKKEYIFPISSFGAEVTLERGYVVADCRKGGANIDFSVIEGYLSEREDLGLKLLMKLGSVSIDSATVRRMLSSGDTVIGLEATQGRDFTLKVNLYNKDGERASEEYPLMRVEFNYSGEYDERATHLYLNEARAENRVYYTYTDGVVSFGAVSGARYILRDDYTVSFIPSSFGENIISASGTLFGVGDRVTLSLNLPAGVILESLYYADYSGENRVSVEERNGAYSFDMPPYNVSVGVSLAYKQYTVSFVSGGATLVTFTHRFGDTVEVPSDPVKVGYTFIGWSPEITEVTGDAVYTAVFEKNAVGDTGEGSEEDTFLGRLLYAGTVCYYMILFLVLPALAVGLTVLVFERRRYVSRRSRRKK